ncbi:hypothetical protein B0H10DRAFT_2236991 [Mycena sp. CBHHK59/15]|nr:hypothetical protein B0H10DRAFT_2236991 [Mycena sp. CBHHK59/15]
MSVQPQKKKPFIGAAPMRPLSCYSSSTSLLTSNAFSSSSLSSSPFGSILYTCTDATSRRCTRTARYGRRHPQGASQSLRDAEGLAGSAPIQMDADAIRPVERAWDCWASWDKADQCRATEVAGSEELVACLHGSSARDTRVGRDARAPSWGAASRNAPGS